MSEIISFLISEIGRMSVELEELRKYKPRKKCSEYRLSLVKEVLE